MMTLTTSPTFSLPLWRVLRLAAAAMGISAFHFYGSLIVLGLGWNFSFIGATLVA